MSITSNLATVQLLTRNYERAVALYECLAQTPEIKNDDLVLLLGDLALAHALAGRFDAATQYKQRFPRLVDSGYWRGGTAIGSLVSVVVALNCESPAEARLALDEFERTANLEGRADFVAVSRLVSAVLDGRDIPYESQHLIAEKAWEALKDPSQNVPTNALERALIDHAGQFLRVCEDMTAIQVDGRAWVDLSRRGPARRILQALVDAYPQAVDAWLLFETAWRQAACLALRNIAAFARDAAVKAQARCRQFRRACDELIGPRVTAKMRVVALAA